VNVTGDPGTQIEVIDIDTGATLGVTILQPAPGHGCGGFADFISPPHSPLSPALIGGHLLLVRNLDDGSFDETFVIDNATATPTHTPTAPYIIATPNCSNNSTATFTIAGFNWPSDEDISLYWNTTQFQETIDASQHDGAFTRTWIINNLTNGTYTIRAISQTGTIAEFDFTVPCP